MTVRELPRADWSHLIGTDMAQLCDLLVAKQLDARILVAEDEDGGVIGHFGLFPAWHAEAMWIAEPYRRHGAVMRGLLRTMQSTAEGMGLKGVVTAAMDPIVEDYLQRLGASRLPGVALVWPFQEKDAVCPSL